MHVQAPTVQIDASGAVKAASTIMQAFYEQRISELKALELQKDTPLSRKLERIWEKLGEISDSPMEAVILLADLLTVELDSRIEIIVA